MRLKKWFQYFSDKDKASLTTDLTTVILSRKRSMCNVLEYGEHKVIYKRYWHKDSSYSPIIHLPTINSTNGLDMQAFISRPA
ncbi:2009_t:CDS:2 [Acaulospora morrowiae]|uniref:2009_t:CDS:1 n=1 Tax=Acaulospora morrowiae TaxID=94023 RepID=A0A9N8WJX0_9GLOM|nr:2009_t:CDS:2 [Acaulospora morrowiae]